MIDEITLYVPNLPGQLNRALKALSEAGVNLLALSMEQSGAYGTVRLIPDNVEKAEKQLQKYAFGSSKTKILAIAVPHEPGGLQDVAELFGTNNINIQYGYVAMPRKSGEATILLKVDKEEEARNILVKRGIRELDKIG